MCAEYEPNKIIDWIEQAVYDNKVILYDWLGSKHQRSN